MAQILWKDGVEPPDAAVGKSKNGSIATYTGSGDEAVEVEEMENPGGSEDQKPELKPETNQSQTTSDYLSEIIARASENLAEQMHQRGRPVEQLTRQAKNGESPSKQQQGQVRPVRPRDVSARSTSAGIYSLAKRRQALSANNAEQLPIVMSEGRQMPILMSLASTASEGSVALVVESTEPEPEKKAQIIPLRFPLTEEQQKSEEFFQQTGMSLEEFRELFKPGWTIAGAISPRENARRVKLGMCNLWYDTELVALKVKHAVREFLYKKRPFPEKPEPETT
jgi:hypothetical protein